MTRADRPPGREREGGPAIAPEPDRPHHANPAARSDAEVIHRIIARDGDSERQRAALLALSDERDLQLRLRLAAWREGYQAALGDAVVASLLRIWPEPGHVPEIEKRRYPPGGRLSWIIPRPGETDGGDRR